MEEPELNRKIAEWLGWQIDTTGEYFRTYSGASGWGYTKNLRFTTSLDACFKYVVPKTQRMGLELRIYGGQLGENSEVLFVEPMGKFGGTIAAEADAKTLAAAFCLAVEKLIDEENN